MNVAEDPPTVSISCEQNTSHQGSMTDATLQSSPTKQSSDCRFHEGCPDGHEWIVFSTSLKDVCLLVQCVHCGARGTVDDPDEQECCEAFHAPSEPYRWDDDSRVTVRGRGRFHVLRAGDVRGEPAPSSKPEGTVS